MRSKNGFFGDEKKVNLSDAELFSVVKVVKILAHGSLRRRFLDLGIIEGTNIEVLYRGALGDPVAYFIRGAVIALRSEDGDMIKVTNCN